MTILSSNGGNSNFVSISREEYEGMQAEIDRLREAMDNMTKSFDNLKAYYPQTHLFVEDCKRRIKQALNGVRGNDE